MAFNFDINKIINTVLTVLWRAIEVPFKLWNKVPPIYKYILFGLICLFAFVLALITWKYRNEWRHRQF